MPRNKIPEDIRKYVNPFRIETGKDFRLNDFDPGETCGLDKGEAADLLQRGIKWLAEKQEMLYAQDRWALLLILQGMDAAGKNSNNKHRMSGGNTPGVPVFAFQ